MTQVYQKFFRLWFLIFFFCSSSSAECKTCYDSAISKCSQCRNSDCLECFSDHYKTMGNAGVVDTCHTADRCVEYFGSLKNGIFTNKEGRGISI